MDSLLSAPNYYANLLSEIDMTHSELSEFMLNVRISFIEVDAARRELLSVQTLFEFIDQDSNGYVALIPRDAAKRIAGIVKSCSQVINGVQACIRKHSRPEDEARESTARWLRRGRETITKLTVSLRVHVTSLLVALHVMMLIIARSSNRTNPRRLTNELLKSGGVPVDPNADPIMGSIREHRAMLPNRTNFDLPILYSDVHELSSYAEAIANGSISMPAHQLDEHPGDSPSRPAPKPKSGLKPMIFDEGSDYGSVQNNGSIAETESTEARSPDPPRFSVPDVPTAAECRSGPQSGTMERERRQQHGESGPRAWGGPSGTINDLRLGTPTSPHTPRGYTFEAARYAATPPPRVHNMPRVGSHDQLKHARTSSVGKKSFHHGGVLIRKQSSDPSMGVTGAHLESNAKEGSSHTASSSWRPRQDTPYYETSLPPRSIMQRAAVDDNLWRTQTLPVRRDPRSLRASRSQEQVPRTLGPVPALISMYPTRSAPMPAYPVQLAPTLIYPSHHPAPAPKSSHSAPALKSFSKPPKTQQSLRSQPREKPTRSLEERFSIPRQQQMALSSVATVVDERPKSGRGQSRTRGRTHEQVARARQPSVGKEQQKRRDRLQPRAKRRVTDDDMNIDDGEDDDSDDGDSDDEGGSGFDYRLVVD